MDSNTAKNVLKMMYDGKLRKITDKCILLPDKSLFNLDTHEIKVLDDKVGRISGYDNMKFIHALQVRTSILYDEYGNLIARINECAKPKIYRISSYEYAILSKEYMYVYNYNIKAITKQIKHTNVFIDRTERKISLTYIDNGVIRTIKLNIL